MMRTAPETRQPSGLPGASIRDVHIGPRRLPGRLQIPDQAQGLVILVHGAGSGRLSPRHAYAVARLHEAKFATLLFDLLSEEESADRRHVFDIGLLAGRVGQAIALAKAEPLLAGLAIGLFGASTGAAAALRAAAAHPGVITALVSRGGRPDLAGEALGEVASPSLFIVGGEDKDVRVLNETARARMACVTDLIVIPGAGHLFEEPGALAAALDAACAWFSRYLHTEAR